MKAILILFLSLLNIFLRIITYSISIYIEKIITIKLCIAIPKLQKIKPLHSSVLLL